MFHPGWRERALAGLGEPFDLVILGGGITGCGILLDAAQRGLRVLLVERQDLAAGTSSRSSKLVHGGLRYLRQLRVKLTRAAVRERDLMLALDPHLVYPLRFLFPVYRGAKTPPWQVELGLRLYGRLAAVGRRHERLGAEELLEAAPGADVEGLLSAFGYLDARADDALLTLAVAGTAFDYGGLVLTRAEPEEGLRDPDGRLRGVSVRDLETGEVHAVEARVVVNATGAWVDALRHRLGFEGERVRPSRGSHLIFSKDRLPIEAALTIPSPDDGRPVFFIPHPEGVLVGTTDLFHQGSLDDPRPSPAEVDYLLRSVRAAFPGRGLSQGDVRGSFAGVRSILDSRATDPTRASREEALWEERGLLSVAGGKLTTWRPMAVEVVDRALRLLPEERAATVPPSATVGTSVGALAPADLPERLRAVHPLEPAVADALARRLGGLAWAACAEAKGPAELRPLAEGFDLTLAEARAHLRYGAVLRLEDLLVRRARAALWAPEVARDLVPRLEALFREEMGWGSGRWQREVEAAGRAIGNWAPPG